MVAGLAAAPSARAQGAGTVYRTQHYDLRLVPVATGLNAPWSLAFLPDGRMLVSEQVGRLRIVTPDGRISRPVAGLPELYVLNQGGLLDITVGPRFEQSRRLYFTFSEPGETYVGTAVARARLDLDAHRLRDVEVIFRQRPKLSGDRHFGARVVLGPDGKLFVTLGDRGQRERVQDPTTTLGTVVRIEPDGGIPAGNPFVGAAARPPAVFATGFRNPQGAAVDPDSGALWVVDHGPTGGDELNRVAAGKNYGWPVATHGVDRDGSPIGVGPHAPGMTPPVHSWTPSIAPSGLSIYTGGLFPAWQGDFLVGALGGRRLVRLERDGRRIVAEEPMLQRLDARIRDVVQGPDGRVYLLTDAPNAELYRLQPAARPRTAQ
nr:PQQ-dependent sugar dehydrogenase [Rhodovibrio sodomensis]